MDVDRIDRNDAPTMNLPTPSTDLADLTSRLGQAWGVTSGEPLLQYLAWCEMGGVFSILDQLGAATTKDIASATVLNERGADTLVCILAALKLVQRDREGKCRLSSLAREYLLRGSPFYVGDALFLKCKQNLPLAYLKDSSYAGTDRTPVGLLLPVQERLRIQHGRNFGPNVVAARTGLFKNVRHLVDVAGGSGVLAIPLALDNPHLQITLVELPETLTAIHKILSAYSLENRVHLLGIDVFKDEWSFGPCDCLFFGNFFHCNDDDACEFLCRKSFEMLPANGYIWLHEVLFEEDRDGPLIAALWNAIMVARSQGAGQRRASDLFEMLQTSGFDDCRRIPTSANFSLVGARKPEWS